MPDERWASTKGGCRGFASYYGPCGDPFCSSCFPGGQVCRQCGELRGDCECDNCESCGCAWQTEFEGQGYEVCPYCHCEDCGDTEKGCECKTGFNNGDPKTNDEKRKEKGSP